jgi:hypothetical protein
MQGIKCPVCGKYTYTFNFYGHTCEGCGCKWEEYEVDTDCEKCGNSEIYVLESGGSIYCCGCKELRYELEENDLK